MVAGRKAASRDGRVPRGMAADGLACVIASVSPEYLMQLVVFHLMCPLTLQKYSKEYYPPKIFPTFFINDEEFSLYCLMLYKKALPAQGGSVPFAFLFLWM